jgi:hypothetical protein
MLKTGKFGKFGKELIAIRRERSVLDENLVTSEINMYRTLSILDKSKSGSIDH